MRDNEEINEKPTTTTSLYSLICDFLADELYRKLTADEYKRLVSMIYCPETPEAESNAGAVEYLIEKTAVNATTNLRRVLPDGSLRNFVNNFKGGRQIHLCRQKRMDYPTAKDIISLICQQPVTFR